MSWLDTLSRIGTLYKEQKMSEQKTAEQDDTTPEQKFTVGKYEIRVTRLTVLPVGEPLYSELATNVDIVDDAAGEYITVTQADSREDATPQQVRFSPDEWPAISMAIASVLSWCRGDEKPEPIPAPPEIGSKVEYAGGTWEVKSWWAKANPHRPQQRWLVDLIQRDEHGNKLRVVDNVPNDMLG